MATTSGKPPSRPRPAEPSWPRQPGSGRSALAVEGTPAWKAIIDAANDHDASLIVLGSHRRAGLSGLVAGSVAGDVTARSDRPVLIIRDHGAADGHRADTSPLAGAAAGTSADPPGDA